MSDPAVGTAGDHRTRPSPTGPPAGADGCRAGWVVVTRESVEVLSRLDQSRFATGRLGVDMPIGLPARPGRAADRAARAFLGPRRSSVFPAPARAVVHHTTHADANAASRALFGCGLPLQSFHLFGKIREVDELARAVAGTDRADHLLEVHPECSFRAMTGRVLPPKRTPEGRLERRAAVAAVFGDPPPPPRGAALDDLLDAFAVLWTMERVERGEHLFLPEAEPPERDEHGIAMRIVV